jgi:hypothetical protein
MIYRGGPSPLPADFRAVFLKGGWKLAERTFGCSNAVLMQWIAASGGPDLLSERARVQRCGRRAGGVEHRGSEAA